MEQTIRFRRIKGKINTNPNQYAIQFARSVSVQRIDNERIVKLKFNNVSSYKRTYEFLKRYIFMHLDADSNKYEIYMPISYILSIQWESTWAVDTYIE